MFSDNSKQQQVQHYINFQNGTPKLIRYSSRRLQPAAMIYFITKLELLGLCVNISQFKQLLAKVDF